VVPNTLPTLEVTMTLGDWHDENPGGTLGYREDFQHREASERTPLLTGTGGAPD
jgi:hypothetical protein